MHFGYYLESKNNCRKKKKLYF